MAWDELGLCHGMELRRGNTFSSQGAPELIAKVFSHLKHKDLKYFRADSAFHNKKVIQALWVPWVYSEEELKKSEISKKKLPVVEVGTGDLEILRGNHQLESFYESSPKNNRAS